MRKLQGWMCPRCGKAHGPDVKTCPEPDSDYMRRNAGRSFDWFDGPISFPEISQQPSRGGLVIRKKPPIVFR